MNKLAANGAGLHGLATAATQLIESLMSSTDPVGSDYLYNTIPNSSATDAEYARRQVRRREEKQKQHPVST